MAMTIDTPSTSNVVCLGSYMKCLKPLFTKIRDKDTGHLEFVKYANRLMVLICEEGFAYSNALSSDRGSSTEDLASGSAIVSERIIQTSAGECFLKTTETVFNSHSSPSVITPTGSKFLGNVKLNHSALNLSRKIGTQ
jgi:hypothetical protein